jgi:hypothetical protein
MRVGTPGVVWPALSSFCSPSPADWALGHAASGVDCRTTVALAVEGHGTWSQRLGLTMSFGLLCEVGPAAEEGSQQVTSGGLPLHAGGLGSWCTPLRASTYGTSPCSITLLLLCPLHPELERQKANAWRPRKHVGHMSACYFFLS